MTYTISARYNSKVEFIQTESESTYKEILTTCRNSGNYDKVIDHETRKASIYTYTYVDYDTLNPVEQEQYNAFDKMRAIFPRDSKVVTVSVYRWHGTYRQQNLVRVLTIADKEIIDITWLVARVTSLSFVDKHGANGLQVDTSAYASEVVSRLAYALYQDDHALNRGLSVPSSW